MQRSTALSQLFNADMTEEQAAAVSFLSRYTGDTLTLYLADLRIWFDWCAVNGLKPLTVERVHLEFFARYLEEDRGNGAGSVHRRLSTLRGFYRIAHADERILKDPTQFLRMPKVIYDESRALGLDRGELRRLLATARASGPVDGALVTLMGFLALRVTEACSVRIEDYADTERGHRVLRLIGKGNKPATIPLPGPVLQALDAAAGDRTSGYLILRRNGQPMDRRAAYDRIKTLAKKAGLPSGVHPHTLRHAAITAALDAGASLRDAQVFARHSDPRITTRYDRGRHNLDHHASYLVAGFITGAG
jgi:integrase/recombinase XerD